MLPDPIERGETRAEAWAERLNLTATHCDCANCGERCDVNEMLTMSPDPYAPLVCCGCADKIIEGRTRTP